MAEEKQGKKSAPVRSERTGNPQSASKNTCSPSTLAKTAPRERPEGKVTVTAQGSPTPSGVHHETNLKQVRTPEDRETLMPSSMKETTPPSTYNSSERGEGRPKTKASKKLPFGSPFLQGTL